MLNRLVFQLLVALACSVAGRGEAAADAADELTASVDCSTPARSLSLPAGNGVTIQSSADAPLFLRIEERGDLLKLTTNEEVATSHISVPYRYGTHLARLASGQVVRLQPATSSTRSTTVQLSVNCATDAAATREREWMAEVAATTEPLAGFLSKQQSATLLKEVARLSASAASARDAALAHHVRAQILLMSSRSADSVVAYADAAKAWQVAGDEARMRVALVGEVEDLQRLARQSEALAVVDKISAILPERDYFASRLRLSRCLSLRYLGRLTDALRCFEVGVTAMERLGETPDLVSALQDMADVSRFLGDLSGARQLAIRALQQSTLPQMETQRGRIHRLLGNIALAQGDVATAITELNLSLTEFVASGSPRWQANALLQIARLYANLGALGEATAFVSSAVEKLSERESPARIAAARTVQADIDSRRGRPDAAREGLAAAAATYTRLNMPVDLDVARLAQARLALEIGDLKTAAAYVASRDQKQALSTIDWLLLAARIDAAHGDCKSATKALQRLHGRFTSIDHDIEGVIASADCLAVNGQSEAAQTKLMLTAQRIAQLSQRVASPLLRQMLVNKIAPLRRTAFRLTAFATSNVTSEPLAVERIWHWLRLDDVALAPHSPAQAGTDATQFDAEVARELLSGQSVESNDAGAPRQLFALLAGTSAQAKSQLPALAETSLKQFQRRLGDAVFVSYVDAGEHAQLLWIRRDSVRLQATLDATRLRAGTESILAAVGEPATPVAAINAEAKRLSEAVLTANQGEAVPSRLLIDASSPLSALAWSVLTWPGSSQTLLESTRISIVRVAETAPAQARTAPDVSVFVAGMGDGGDRGVLRNAEAEPALIQHGIAARNGRVNRIAGNDRGALLDAFARPHGWLHVAAHGDARASRIGYAGIWLDAESGDAAPPFFSWLEILARGSRSDLVVLNACDLADNQGNEMAALSFADAVSRAGARDVVAARWQVSDAATALWVPLFYRQVTEGATPAEAVWQIRRQLHDSRRFRHPFYWAAWVHFGHL